MRSAPGQKLAIVFDMACDLDFQRDVPDIECLAQLGLESLLGQRCFAGSSDELWLLSRNMNYFFLHSSGSRLFDYVYPISKHPFVSVPAINTFPASSTLVSQLVDHGPG